MAGAHHHHNQHSSRHKGGGGGATTTNRKRTSEKEGYAEKKQKMTTLLLPNNKKTIIPNNNSNNSTSVAILQSWSDRSNVGNLSIRQKWVLCGFIFSSMLVVWILCLSFCLCGKAPGTADCQLIQDLTICKTTWSTISYLTANDQQQDDHTAVIETNNNDALLLLQQQQQQVVSLLQRESKTLQSQVTKLQQKLQNERKEVSSLKNLVSETTKLNADTTAKWKHCKSDVKDEIFKKQACGKKLHILMRSVDELQETITDLQAECKQQETAKIVAEPEAKQIEEKKVGTENQKRNGKMMMGRNPLGRLFQGRRRGKNNEL